MHKSRLSNLTIDCNGDLDVAARFGSAALGCPARDAGDDAFVQLRTKPGDVRIMLQRVTHAPHVRVDIETDDIAAEVARLEGLGAIVVATRELWTVMQAPSGHRFCVGRVFRDGFHDDATHHEP